MTLRRPSTILLGSFAVLALLVAIGAHCSDVLRFILRQAMQVAVFGEVIGFAIALLSTRFASAVLYGVSPVDGWTLAVALIAMTLVSLLASYIPSLRATKVDPMVALRTQ